MNFCLTADVIAKLKPRMKALGGEKLVAMNTQQLSDFFAESVGTKIAPDVARTFRKAALDHRKDAMSKWAQKALNPNKDEIARVKKMADEMVEDDVYENIDGDVMERALGVDITPEEVDKINDLTKKLHEAAKKESDNKFTGLHSDFQKIKKELNDYLDSVNPMSSAEKLSRVTFRGNLLFSPKSIVTNIVGNLTGGVSEKLVQSMLSRKFSGVNTDLVKEYAEFAVKTYLESGIDVVRAMDASSGSTLLGEHFKGVGNGKDPLTVYSRFIDQYVLRMGQGTPDIYAAGLHFADYLNVQTTKLADQKGLTGDAHKKEARRLFTMATSLTLEEDTIEHAEAYALKQGALEYALTATYQNDNQVSKVALDIRNGLDDYTGALYLGTNLTPFVKTLINISILSVQMSGVTAPFNAVKLAYAYRTGDIKTIRSSWKTITRAGLGLVLATLIAQMLGDDDYLPDYTLATGYQRELAKLANAPYNSIRIGNKWFSLAYFGTLGYAISGMLSARKKRTMTEQGFEYYLTVGRQLRTVPIIQQGIDAYDYANDIKKYNKDGQDMVDDSVSYVANFMTARLIPAISGDIAKGLDDKERYIPFGVDGIWDTVQNKVPIWRNYLPPKWNNLGQNIPTEGMLLSVLAGARIKTAPPDTVVYTELQKLASGGTELTINFTAYKDVKIARSILTGREYNELTGILQKTEMQRWAEIMADPLYQQETDPEEKKKLLSAVRKGIVEEVMWDLGYDTRIQEVKDQQGE